MMKKRKLGIIGGSGLYKMEGFEKIKWKKPFKIPVENEEDLQKSIIKVDRYCGIVIYLSIWSIF